MPNAIGKCAIFDTALEVASLTAMLGNHIKSRLSEISGIAKAEAFHAA